MLCIGWRAYVRGWLRCHNAIASVLRTLAIAQQCHVVTCHLSAVLLLRAVRVCPGNNAWSMSAGEGSEFWCSKRLAEQVAAGHLPVLCHCRKLPEACPMRCDR